MENFIKKIFDIDDEAEELKKVLEEKKQNLSKKFDEEIENIDTHYRRVVEEEKNNLSSRLKEIEAQEKLRLDDYEKKAEKLKLIFLQKKDELLEKISGNLL